MRAGGLLLLACAADPEPWLSEMRDLVEEIREAHFPELRLVATSATREAVNSEAFLRKIEKTTGLAVEVISGQEEGRLTYLGVLSSLPVKERKLVMVDIGGGSTEILLGEGGRPLYVQSVRLGHLRLWEKFFAAPAALPDQRPTGAAQQRS